MQLNWPCERFEKGWNSACPTFLFLRNATKCYQYGCNLTIPNSLRWSKCLSFSCQLGASFMIELSISCNGASREWYPWKTITEQVQGGYYHWSYMELSLVDHVHKESWKESYQYLYGILNCTRTQPMEAIWSTPWYFQRQNTSDRIPGTCLNFWLTIRLRMISWRHGQCGTYGLK